MLFSNRRPVEDERAVGRPRSRSDDILPCGETTLARHQVAEQVLLLIRHAVMPAESQESASSIHVFHERAGRGQAGGFRPRRPPAPSPVSPVVGDLAPGRDASTQWCHESDLVVAYYRARACPLRRAGAETWVVGQSAPTLDRPPPSPRETPGSQPYGAVAFRKLAFDLVVFAGKLAPAAPGLGPWLR